MKLSLLIKSVLSSCLGILIPFSTEISFNVGQGSKDLPVLNAQISPALFKASVARATPLLQVPHHQTREILISQELEFRSPELQEPGQLDGGTSRSRESLESPQSNVLVGLLPESNIGLSIFQFPSFFFYISEDLAQQGDKTATFSLETERGEVIYTTELSLPQQGGVVQFELPSSEDSTGLELERNYRWTLTVSTPEMEESTYGWVRRIEIPTTLQQELEAAKAGDRPKIYAKEGLWYEALTELAKLRLANPDDTALTAQWESLLGSVELEALASQPLLEDFVSQSVVEGESPQDNEEGETQTIETTPSRGSGSRFPDMFPGGGHDGGGSR